MLALNIGLISAIGFLKPGNLDRCRIASGAPFNAIQQLEQQSGPLMLRQRQGLSLYFVRGNSHVIASFRRFDVTLLRNTREQHQPIANVSAHLTD
jgi:hypothetical protein